MGFDCRDSWDLPFVAQRSETAKSQRTETMRFFDTSRGVKVPLFY
jgi:hypothetical protein